MAVALALSSVADESSCAFLNVHSGKRLMDRGEAERACAAFETGLEARTVRGSLNRRLRQALDEAIAKVRSRQGLFFCLFCASLRSGVLPEAAQRSTMSAG